MPTPFEAVNLYMCFRMYLLVLLVLTREIVYGVVFGVLVCLVFHSFVTYVHLCMRAYCLRQVEGKKG